MLYLIGNHNDNFTNHASCQASCKYYLYGDIEFLSKISTGFMFLLLQSINYCSATFCFQPLESEIWLQHMQHYGESPGLIALLVSCQYLSNEIIDNYAVQQKGLIVREYQAISSGQ